MQKSRHLLALLLCLVMMFSVAAPASVVLQASAATASSTQTIKLNKTKAAVYNGKKLKLKVSGTKQTVKWYTTDQKIATVKNGVVTTKKAGTVKIAAKVAGQKLVCKVTVKPALVASTKEVTMTAGKAKKAVLALYAADGDVACKIADPAIASYKFGDWNGKKIGLKLTGKKAGVTTATVTNSVTKDKVKIKITVKAKAQPAAKPLTASATAVSLAPGEVKTVTLTESPASQLALTTAQPDIVRCSWSGAWVNGASALTLTGLKEGKTTITVADTVSKQSVVLNVVVGCDHVFSDAYIVDQAATCTAAGKESTHCIICGAVGATREIPPVAHDYAEEYTIDVPSTCSKAGEQSRHCKVCGARTDIKPVEKAPHDYGVPTVTKEASCKEAGSQTSLCKICGAQNVETIPVKDHTLGAWTVEKAATCKEAGVEAATCSVCGSKVTREIPQKEHTLGAWTVEKAATCKEAGVEAAVCSVCNTKVTREIPTTTAHNYGDWTVTKAATCQETGVETATCSICGNKQTREIAKVGHNFSTEFTTDTPATCGTAGSKSKHCTVCGEKSEITAIPATGNHTFGSWKESGDKKTRTCSVCGYAETKYINPTIAAEETNITLKVKQSESVNLEVKDRAPVSCTSSNPSVVSAQISGSTYSRRVDLEGVGTGTAIVTVTNNDTNESDQIHVTVEGGVIIDMPTIPITLNEYRSRDDNTVLQTYQISTITYEIYRYNESDDDYTVYLYFGGKKTFDRNGDGQSSSAKIGWKLYNERNEVVDSDTCYAPSVATGDTWSTTSAREYISDLKAGHYRLEIMSVN